MVRFSHSSVNFKNLWQQTIGLIEPCQTQGLYLGHISSSFACTIYVFVGDCAVLAGKAIFNCFSGCKYWKAPITCIAIQYFVYSTSNPRP